MTMAIRNTVKNAREFIKWSAVAKTGQTMTYHIGNLAKDRADSVSLHLLAETVLLLAETGYVAPRQIIMRLPMGSAIWYSASRTGTGMMPRSIMFGQCDAFTYRALQAIRNRDASQSAGRAIRDFIGCPEQLALDYLALLYAKSWVEPAESKGWQLSPEGLRMLT